MTKQECSILLAFLVQIRGAQHTIITRIDFVQFQITYFSLTRLFGKSSNVHIQTLKHFFCSPSFAQTRLDANEKSSYITTRGSSSYSLFFLWNSNWVPAE